jgi:hypothetical protein
LAEKAAPKEQQKSIENKDIKEFIEGVNKKDKLHGKKVDFGFTKRKRKY